jgi:hypothetical protein
MYCRGLAALIVTGCLIAVLAGGASVWGIRQGLVQAPTGIARLGDLEVMAFTGVQFSSARPPRGYYTVWIALRKDSPMRPRSWRRLAWAYRLMRIELPAAAVQ